MPHLPQRLETEPHVQQSIAFIFYYIYSTLKNSTVSSRGRYKALDARRSVRPSGGPVSHIQAALIQHTHDHEQAAFYALIKETVHRSVQFSPYLQWNIS